MNDHGRSGPSPPAAPPTPDAAIPEGAAGFTELTAGEAAALPSAQALRVLGRQLRNAVLILLAVTAIVAFFLGNGTDAVIIGVILVPGDVVRLALGGIVPADLRLLATTGLECDESVLTGESLPVDKTVASVPQDTALAELSCCALMGTVVRAGDGTGVVVSTSLAAGSRQLARRKVLVKRLVCIEDLGDMDILVTDKTGTLTEGRIDFLAALDPCGNGNDRVLLLGLLATETDLTANDRATVGGNPLDAALWRAPDALAHPIDGYTRLGLLPFDHERRMTTAVLSAPDGTRLPVTKGAPEAVLERCWDVPAEAAETLEARFAEGGRVVAVATRSVPDLTVPAPMDEQGLALAGFLVFLDRPKAAAAASLRRLAALGITVKIATGDNPLVAEKVCASLGLTSGGTLTGADVVVLEKDLGVLADGVAEGRRIFTNTIKYVLMGTSSNFGNMFSAASASAVLSFLPMLPSQILLNNLLYDTSQLSIPTDRVDPEQLHAPSHWDIGFIRRFMFFFGPISSLFDFLTFAVMLGVFHAGPELFFAGADGRPPVVRHRDHAHHVQRRASRFSHPGPLPSGDGR
ncbi:magnesium-transporting ATPase (P-type) [Streptosporangium album]|uniref:Magnesium-transporting ATPase (P-type) n=1 Tax=Streptosporangium album TaxID=47479 RepID=A0A7W7WE56_9ACTN|nr:cation transporting ATPase C-terminal domain-containing protein [Streptosporangium album]MBB4943019.1 magnesium-transporting ATPase (P-type) [Streptosporangium album]